ncbi:MAG: YigZ family protein [Desulfuromonadaceae bacterium]|nr:YigZ family protein [Geobacteraceae bacterium]
MSYTTQRYPIPQTTLRTRIEVKRSRFIATATYTPDIEQSNNFIACVKEEYADANHNCWARVFGAPGSTEHAGMSDDGEPQGAAGKPMLTALLYADIGDTTVVVSRYFGGIKLGKGGMARAYTDALLQVLERMPLEEKISYTELHMYVEYPLFNMVERILPAYEARIDSCDFGVGINLHLQVPIEQRAELIRHLTELSAGAIRITAAQQDMDT